MFDSKTLSKTPIAINTNVWYSEKYKLCRLLTFKNRKENKDNLFREEIKGKGSHWHRSQAETSVSLLNICVKDISYYTTNPDSNQTREKIGTETYCDNWFLLLIISNNFGSYTITIKRLMTSEA